MAPQGTRPGKSRRKGPVEQGQLRLIAGEWRRRQLQFPAVDGVRPTPDRVRETLFSWLLPQLPGSRCLDLFAGSGVLGLEALSRGAAFATFVDQSSGLCRALRDNLALLNASHRGEVQQQSCQDFLARGTDSPCQLVFMDPPYGQGLIAPLCQALEHHGWLAPGAMICVEQESTAVAPVVPPRWQLHRHKQAGQVSVFLFQIKENG
ncbi:MAG: 16S rRNA (guanine(966)-N(2))-methyltransferase RsmD [Halomonadaceae bacterium]|nr:MAG: 16S rRNA (guanine(966)-N(2))-methyltransferase RsmD [Halomonadaceae bacterium]